MKRSQTAWVIIVTFIIVSAIFLWKVEPIVANLVAGILIFIALPLLYKLTIKVDDEYIRFSFGIGLIRGKYALSSIKSCKAITYTPFGWGIRFRRGVIIFNVSGNKALALEFRDKKHKIWIGTDVPDELANFINQKIGVKLLIRK